VLHGFSGPQSRKFSFSFGCLIITLPMIQNLSSIQMLITGAGELRHKGSVLFVGVVDSISFLLRSYSRLYFRRWVMTWL